MHGNRTDDRSRTNDSPHTAHGSPHTAHGSPRRPAGRAFRLGPRTIRPLIVALAWLLGTGTFGQGMVRGQGADPSAVVGVWRGIWKLTILTGGNDDVLLIEAKTRGLHLAGDVLRGATYFGDATVTRVDTERNALRLTFLSNGEPFEFHGQAGTEGPYSGSYVGTVERGGQTAAACLTPSDRTAELVQDATLRKALDHAKNLPDPAERLQHLQSLAETHRRHPAAVRIAATWLRELPKATAVPENRILAVLDGIAEGIRPFGPCWTREAVLQWLAATEGQPETRGLRRRLLALLPTLSESPLPLEKQVGLAYWNWETLRDSGDTAGADAAKTRWQELRDGLEARETEASWPFGTAVLTAPKDPRLARTVLVELFAGPNCRPSAQAALAAEGLRRSTTPGECVVVTYPLHAGGGNPLVSPAALQRAAEARVERTPTLLVDGEPLFSPGGAASSVPGMFRELVRRTESERGRPRRTELALTARREGERLRVAATANLAASEGTHDSADLRLRVALADERVRYEGENGLRIHPFVVWDWVGSYEGLPLIDRQARCDTVLELPQVRKRITDYHRDYERRHKATFRRDVEESLLARPWAIAWLYDARTGQVLHAAAVPAAPAP